jgi:hypothetical protein
VKLCYGLGGRCIILLLSKVYRLECYGNDVYMKRLPTTAHDGALLCNQCWHRSGIAIVDVPRICASFVRPSQSGRCGFAVLKDSEAWRLQHHDSPDRLPFSPYNAFMNDTFRSLAARRWSRVKRLHS